MKQRIVEYLRHHWHALVQLHDTPHAIAGGVAIGVFIGFTPLVTLKTFLAILIAWAFRCSKVSAAVAVNFHDITIPFAPVILRLEYGIGYWLLAHPHVWPPKVRLGHIDFRELFRWHKFVAIIWPTLLGSIFFGLPIAVVSFFVTLPIVRRYQEHRQHKLAAEAEAQAPAEKRHSPES